MKIIGRYTDTFGKGKPPEIELYDHEKGTTYQFTEPAPVTAEDYEIITGEKLN